jgi:Flavin containing amine oxidoreductase
MTDVSPPPKVAVIGAGIAGMTSALRLAQRGYDVTLFESTDRLGGNVSSSVRKVNGKPVYYDVYPHMYCAWYANFFALLSAKDDLNLDLSKEFVSSWGFQVAVPSVEKDKRCEFIALRNANTPQDIVHNIFSGLAAPEEMFLLGFSMLDLAARPGLAFNEKALINQLDVNAFMYSRGYFTENLARLHDFFLKVVWSIPSALTSATAYQSFIKHTLTYPEPLPFCYLLKGSLQEKLIAPFKAALCRAKCKIKMNTPVRSVLLAGQGSGKDAKVLLGVGDADTGLAEETFDYAILAVPSQAMADLVLNGPPGQRIADRVHSLAQVRHSRSVAIPVMTLFFKPGFKLKDIPNEIFSLKDSGYDHSVLDISRIWLDDPNMKDRTVLTVAASNGFAVPAAQTDPERTGFYMIKRLHEYIGGFQPGEQWGDPNSDVDWDYSDLRPNVENLLFEDDPSSGIWRPQTSYDRLPKVFFAGDICINDVDMATVETAVISGVQAAQKVQEGEPLGEPIILREHKTYSELAMLTAKLFWLPTAYGAAALSNAKTLFGESATGRQDHNFPWWAENLLLPTSFTLDAMRTLFWWLDAARHELVAKLGERDAAPALGVASDDEVRKVWPDGYQWLAADVAYGPNYFQPTAGQEIPPPSFRDSWNQLMKDRTSLKQMARSLLRGPAQSQAETMPKRRARAKS